MEIEPIRAGTMVNLFTDSQYCALRLLDTLPADDLLDYRVARGMGVDLREFPSVREVENHVHLRAQQLNGGCIVKMGQGPSSRGGQGHSSSPGRGEPDQGHPR